MNFVKKPGEMLTQAIKTKLKRPSVRKVNIKKSDTASKKLNEAKQKATDIKTSTYTLGKAPENLTSNQAARLEMIANTNPRLFRGYKLKEQLRLTLKYPDLEEAKAELKCFFWRATHSRTEFKFSKSLPIKLGDMRSIFSIQ